MLIDGGHFIFQPAEEVLESGARRMIEEGLFERFQCDAIYGLHNYPELPLGVGAVRTGPMLAAADKIAITVTGKGGHAAFPHTIIDPLPAACQIVCALQTIVSRRIDPFDTAVVSITMIEGSRAFSVTPNEVALGGTVRTLRPQTRKLIEEEIRRMSSGIAEANGCVASVDVKRGHPATINHEREARIAGEALEAALGSDKVRRDVTPSMGGEDFGYYLERKPGAFVFLGQGGAPLHSPAYDFNDKLLLPGVEFFHGLVTAELGRDRSIN